MKIFIPIFIWLCPSIKFTFKTNFPSQKMDSEYKKIEYRFGANFYLFQILKSIFVSFENRIVKIIWFKWFEEWKMEVLRTYFWLPVLIWGKFCSAQGFQSKKPTQSSKTSWEKLDSTGHSLSLFFFFKEICGKVQVKCSKTFNSYFPS